MLRDTGDIVDRLCIAQLKAERIASPEAKREFREFWEAIFTLLLIYPDFPWWPTISDMYDIHKRIWEMEADIRQGKLDHDEMEVGRRAIILRDLNRKRIEIKNYINMTLGEEAREQKKDHLSQGDVQ